jgi:tRNA G46 methylase TrmB
LTLALFRRARSRHRPRASQSVLSPFDDTPKRENGWECMETILGKRTCFIDAGALAARLAGYEQIAFDIGTGDGRYVRDVARQSPASFIIGIDACRENLRATSRNAPANALFVIANALALPGACTAWRRGSRSTTRGGACLPGCLTAMRCSSRALPPSRGPARHWKSG